MVAGRLEFAPAVKDLAADGFPLAGARLDYIDGRRVAALVYRRPSTEVEAAPREPSVRDYNLISWRRGGIADWAVSDLGMAELRELQGRL